MTKISVNTFFDIIAVEMVHNMREAIDYLNKYIPKPSNRHPGELGLLRMQELVNLIGNPHFTYKTIHVGGTSGKGSTATIIAQILGQKYKVGLHTSPHLIKVNERIKIVSIIKNKESNIRTDDKISGIDISNKDFVKLVNFIKPAIKKMENGNCGAPSFFEIITAIALYYFKQKMVDVAVIEVGMGGRYDATNIIQPDVAVLTNVGLDHTEVLGDTIEKIAMDKAGIIKPEIKIVAGIKQASVVKIVERKCLKENAKLYLSGRDFSYFIKKATDNDICFNYSNNQSEERIHLPLVGIHQAENAALAIKTCELFFGKGLNGSFINRSLRNISIPGRMQVISKNPLVVFDGAHNPDKINALVNSIKIIWSDKKIKTILAVKNDKNIKDMLIGLMKITGEFILTQYKILVDYGNIESYKATELAKLIKTFGGQIKIRIIKSPKDAFIKTLEEPGERDLILVTGSLYLIGAIMESSYFQRIKSRNN